MPNHIHGIVIINGGDRNADVANGANCHLPVQVEANGNSPTHSLTQMKPRSLSSFVTGFKSATTKQINIHRNTWEIPVWQRNYYEHIICNPVKLYQNTLAKTLFSSTVASQYKKYPQSKRHLEAAPTAPSD